MVLPKKKPTGEAYGELQKAYDYFNRRLFENENPACIITLQRFHRSAGYFLPNGWRDEEGALTDEISINPRYVDRKDLPGVFSTLVHEMVHQWQHHFGKPGRRGYHNRQWADKMISVGLTPSQTGKPGGAKTGRPMSHYIKEGGRFEQASDKLIRNGFVLTWEDGWDRQKYWKKKTKYQCPQCKVSCWSRPDWMFRCEFCKKRMKEFKPKR